MHVALQNRRTVLRTLDLSNESLVPTDEPTNE